MGLRNLSTAQMANWVRVTNPRREVQETKFLHIPTLETLKLRRPVARLLGKVGLKDFLGAKAQTYVRYTLEFLATLERGVDEEGPFITFNLNDVLRKMYYPEVMEAFGWDYVVDDDFNSPEVFEEATFFSQVTNGLVWHSRVRSSSFPHPALRLVHRFLAMTVFCNAEPTNVPKLDLRCLWAMTPQGLGCPDWVHIFVGKVINLRTREKGHFSFGGMVTLLADYLNVDLPVDNHGNPLLFPLGDPGTRYTFPSNEYNVAQLKTCGMIWKTPNVSDLVWTFGPNGVRYMAVPQPNKTDIPPDASHPMLYVPPDRQYMAEVQFELNKILGGQQEQQAQQEESGEEEGEDVGHYRGLGRGQGRGQARGRGRVGTSGQGVHLEEQEQGWQATMDQRMNRFEIAQNSMELRLDQMQHQFDSFEDNVFSMSSMVSAMNQFYVSQYPNYNDPTQEIERRRQQRLQERASRRHGSRDPGGPSGS